MNKDLQEILNIIEQSEHLDGAEKAALLKSAKGVDQELELISFKLDRTEKVKHTTATLLEETIEELEQKRKAVESQNRELEIESSLEKVRTVAMGMRKRDDMLDICRTMSAQLELLGIKEIRNVQTAIFYEEKGTYVNYEYYRLYDKTFITEVDYTYKLDTITTEFAERMMKGANEVFIRSITGDQVRDWLNFQKTTNVFIDTHLEKATSLTYYWFSLGPVALGTSTYEPLSGPEIRLFERFRNVFGLAYQRYIDIEQAEAQAREAQIQLALERVRARTMAMQHSDELKEAAALLFQQAKTLGVPAYSCGYNLWETNATTFTSWMSSQDGSQINAVLNIPLNEDANFIRYAESKRKGESFFVLELRGERMQEHYEYLKTIPAFKRFFDYAVSVGFNLPETQIHHVINFSHGNLLFITLEPCPEFHEVFKRFAAVFEQTYTRFLDLQKAEAQAREAKIEAALEKVRSRSLAMHKSDELNEVVTILFEKIKELQIPVTAVGIGIYIDGSKDMNTYVCGENEDRLVINNYRLPYFHHEIWKDLNHAREKQFDFFSGNYSREEKNSFYQYVLEHSALSQLPEDIKSLIFESQAYTISMAPVQHSMFMINDFEGKTLSGSEVDIVRRFARVFDQAYTRFLDLQKAETRAREARIEAALERTRTQSMLMQHSTELDDTLRVFHEQVLLLGIQSAFSFLWLPDEAEERHIFWAAWAENGSPAQPGNHHPVLFKSKGINYPLDRNEPATAQCLVDWKSTEPIVSYHVPPAGVKNYFAAWQELINGAEQLKPQYFSGGLYYVEAFMKYGCFGVLVSTDLDESDKKILGRFAIEFERTYTRFLDLQKAEAQAREAKIEAALEKVRSRTMAMQKSADLGDTSALLFNQLNALVPELWTCGFVLCDKDKPVDEWWLSGGSGFMPDLYLPNVGDALHNNIYQAWLNGESYYEEVITGEPLQRHYQWLMTIPSAQAAFESQAAAGIMQPVWQQLSCAYFSRGYLVVITEKPCGEVQVFKRFAQVFEQTYTRFKDLEKAEAQALEAIKRASVDRVRAEIASMRTTSDLERITPLIWSELTTLGVPFIRCGVFIIDEEHHLVQTHLSTPNGEAIASFASDLSDPGIMTEALPHWRKKEIYQTHWNEAAFLEQAKSLVRQGSIVSDEKYLTENRPTSLYLHFLPFIQGMLYVGNTEPLREDGLQLVQNLADAFATAYARYEDFNKLEFAKEQVEKTLVDLKQAQTQLVQSEKMASLGELTAGIAHEIQNPLNFVNNFSDVSSELLDEMRTELKKGNTDEAICIAEDVKQNLEKILHHGRRADAIVKGMLQHSRSSSGQKEPTDINVLADEYLRLAYHGFRAKDKSFNVKFETNFDNNIGMINIIPQDIGRVLVNLISNAFYAVGERQKAEGVGKPARQEGYAGSVSLGTRKIGDRVEIRVADNGNGIPEGIRDKVFQPFFTTKPTGQGTGLGLSLSYDIVKAHGGEISVETKEGEGSEFIISLPA